LITIQRTTNNNNIVNKFSQGTDPVISIKKSDLEKMAPGEMKVIEDKANELDLEKKVERYGKFVGIGKEIGIAVNGAL
jgi:hypothetical protein